MTKMLVFDMDGTIADFYGYPNWLNLIRAGDSSPYLNAKPLYPMDELCALLNELRAYGIKIAVTSWLSKESCPEFDKATRTAKREWLNRYNFPADEIHLVKYGTDKARATRNKADFQILVDDNAEIRMKWKLGATIDAKNENVLTVLQAMLKEVKTA